MDEILYKALSSYYHALSVKGYMSDRHSHILLVLCFYYEFMFNDYRGIISESDYIEIEKALSRLYGSSCLIPYPNYLKMAKLHLGQVSELAHRVREMEETPVLKIADTEAEVDSDIIIVESED